MFAKTAGRRLQFSLKTKPVLALCVVCVVVQNAAAQLAPLNLALWKTPACTINIIALIAYLAYWICLTDCLSQAGEAIAHDLEVTSGNPCLNVLGTGTHHGSSPCNANSVFYNTVEQYSGKINNAIDSIDGSCLYSEYHESR